MNDERARRINDIFAEVLVTETAERERFLEHACRSAETREEIHMLLEAHARMGDFLVTPAAERVAPRTLEPGATVGAYRIVRVLGSGGAGTVYEAEQASPQRRVALKIMHAGLASETSQRRFRDEAEILARLGHPSVAHVYEGGVYEGVPCFAMEYVPDARTIVEHAVALDTAARLELFARVCEAIHHGHQKGVIHRDIKPSNVLVDPSGRPKVIDFGVARVEGMVANRREIVGTLPYMSPEQFEPGEDVDVRTDVYSLGVLLYELISGKLPYDVSTTSITEATRIIRNEPPAPLDRVFRGDIEAIVRKALEKNRDRRYASAAALADDIRRYLTDRPVEAHKPSLVYQLRKFARRQRTVTVAVAAVIVISIAAAIVSGAFAIENARERRIAEAARRRAEAQAYVANIAAADAALRVYDVAEARRRLLEAKPELRNWEWRYLVSRLDRSLRTFAGPRGACYAVDFNESGTRLVSLVSDPDLPVDCFVSVFDTRSGQELARRGPLDPYSRSPTFSPDGRWIAWGSDDGTVSLVNATTLETAGVFRGHTGACSHLAFRADGAVLASSSSDGTVRLWRVPTGEHLRTLCEGKTTPTDLAFHADDRHLAVGASDGSITLWDVNTHQKVRSLGGPGAAIRALAFEGAGDRIVTCSFEAAFHVWDTGTGRKLGTLTGTRDVSAVAFTADGTRVVSGHTDGTLTVRQARTGVEIATLWGHAALISSLSVNRKTGRLASSSHDGTARIWDLDAAPGPTTLGEHTRLVRDLTYSPDGRWLVAASFEGVLKVYELATGQEAILEDDAPGSRVRSVCFGTDPEILAAGSATGAVKLWNLTSRRCIATFRGLRAAYSVALSLDGQRVVAGAPDGTVIVWDTRTGNEVHRLPHRQWVAAVAFHREGRLLASACSDGWVRLWSVSSGTEVCRIEIHGPNAVAFSPDGDTVATGSKDGRVELWEVATGRRSASFGRLPARVERIVFSPDGTRVAAAAQRTIRLWDVATARAVLNLRGNRWIIYGLAFSPDGTQIAAGGGSYAGHDCTIRLWGNVPGGTWPPQLGTDANPTER